MRWVKWSEASTNEKIGKVAALIICLIAIIIGLKDILG